MYEAEDARVMDAGLLVSAQASFVAIDSDCDSLEVASIVSSNAA